MLATYALYLIGFGYDVPWENKVFIIRHTYDFINPTANPEHDYIVVIVYFLHLFVTTVIFVFGVLVFIKMTDGYFLHYFISRRYGKKIYIIPFWLCIVCIFLVLLWTFFTLYYIKANFEMLWVSYYFFYPRPKIV